MWPLAFSSFVGQHQVGCVIIARWRKEYSYRETAVRACDKCIDTNLQRQEFRKAGIYISLSLLSPYMDKVSSILVIYNIQLSH